jgi:hypothetical protein
MAVTIPVSEDTFLKLVDEVLEAERNFDKAWANKRKEAEHNWDRGVRPPPNDEVEQTYLTLNKCRVVLAKFIMDYYRTSS